MKISQYMTMVLFPALCLMACAESKQSAEPPATPESGAEATPAPTAEQTAPAEPAPKPAETAAPAPAPERPKTVEVTLQAKSGSKLSGKATLTETADGVHVVMALENVKPGDHGAHVHEKGDCSAADAASAGGHFNPKSHPHGLPAQAERHLGDLGNVVIGKDGKGNQDITIAGANLKASDPNSFLGRAIVIHEKKDDGGQPTGNAGGRIGCGEIK